MREQLDRLSISRRTACVSLGSALLGWTAAAQPSQSANALLVRNGREITPTGTRLRDVLIERDRIVANVPSGTITPRRAMRVVDAAGAFVLPGLIDSHAHYGWAGDVGEGFGPAWLTTGKQLLASGVTTVRMHLSDPAEMAAYTARSEDRETAWPRVQLGGKGLIGGAPRLDRSLVWGVAGASDAQSKLKRSRSAGASWVALHEVDRFAGEEINAISVAAKRASVALLGSGERMAEVPIALRAGVRSIEYLDLSPTAVYPKEIIEALQARGRDLFMVPTIGHYFRHMSYVRGEDAGSSPEGTRFMTVPSAERLRSSTRERFAAAPNDYARRLRSSFATLEGKFRQLRSAGLEMVIGSDCGSPGQYHGDAIWWDMATWHSLGVPPREVIVAATSRPARMLRRPDLGTLARGARGDVLIYDGDLESGEFDVGNVRGVIKGGRVRVEAGRWLD